jgi:hypothetical protein
MAQSFQLREQAGRCRRPARDSTDPTLRDRLPGLAGEYTTGANAREKDDKVVWHAGSHDEGAA